MPVICGRHDTSCLFDHDGSRPGNGRRRGCFEGDRHFRYGGTVCWRRACNDVWDDIPLHMDGKRLYAWSNEKCSRQRLFQNEGISGKAFVWNGSYPDHESDYILCDIDNRISPHRNAGGGQVIFPEPADLFWSPAAFWSCCQQYCHCHL